MKKASIFLLLAGLLAGLMLSARHSQAAPAAQSTNLLQNPSFEQTYSGGVANGWQRWSRSTPRSDDECLVAYHFEPRWNSETSGTYVRDGATSQYIGNNWDTWSAGVFQNVPATPGTTYRFTFSGRGRGTNEPAPAPSESGLQINMRAGIDPNGSGLWNDTDVVWGAFGSPHDQWQEFSVEATATGSQITVFTSVDWAVTGINQCRQFLDTWYDAGQLIALTPPSPVPPTAAPATTAPPTVAPPPAATDVIPTEPAAATLAATLTVVPTETPAGTATICVNAFLDANANGLHDADEGHIAGVTLTVAQGNAIIGQAVSPGNETPICFGNLPAGTYQVGQTVPPALEMTTQANATISIVDGQTVGLEFGSRPRTEATVVVEVTPTEAAAVTTETPVPPVEADGASNWLVFLGLGAMLVGVVLLGVLLFMILRR
jgi:hypothetical protein